jgi:hypothetical protein
LGAQVSLFSRHRSFTEKVLSAQKRRKVAGRILVLLLVVAASHAFLLRAYRVSTDTMRPGLEKGDLVLASPLLGEITTVFGRLPPLLPLKRGALVVVLPATSRSESLAFKGWDSLVRFFTFQRVSPLSDVRGREQTSPGLYRVLGLPGDRLRSKGSFYEIKAAGAAGYSTEYLATGKEYMISGQSRSTQASLADSQETLLGDGEYYVACDDRSVFDGSALWGPLRLDRVEGRLILVFWPLKRIKFL